MSTWKFFKDDEVKGLHPPLVDMLDGARELCGFPFVITSGYRDPEKNLQVGGVPFSSHTKGLAVDLAAPKDAVLREKMAWALGRVGFRRVFRYAAHLHVDIDAEKPQDLFQEKTYGT